MEPVPATSGARRTVRVAAALVVGQVLLVAIVGWVTLTGSGGHPAGSAAGVDRMAAPPAMIGPGSPATTAPDFGKGPASGATSGTSGSPGNGNQGNGNGNDGPAAGLDDHPAGDSGRAAHPPATRATGRAATESGTDPTGPVATPTPLATSSAPLGLTPPISPAATPSPGVSTSTAPVVVGQPCYQWGAVARTDDGRTVRCVPAAPHQLRWKIV